MWPRLSRSHDRVTPPVFADTMPKPRHRFCRQSRQRSSPRAHPPRPHGRHLPAPASNGQDLPRPDRRANPRPPYPRSRANLWITRHDPRRPRPRGHADRRIVRQGPHPPHHRSHPQMGGFVARRPGFVLRISGPGWVRFANFGPGLGSFKEAAARRLRPEARPHFERPRHRTASPARVCPRSGRSPKNIEDLLTRLNLSNPPFNCSRARFQPW